MMILDVNLIEVVMVLIVFQISGYRFPGISLALIQQGKIHIDTIKNSDLAALQLLLRHDEVPKLNIGEALDNPENIFKVPVIVVLVKLLTLIDIVGILILGF